MRMRRIDTPDYAPEYHRRAAIRFHGGVALAEYQQVQSVRAAMLAAHHAAVEAFWAEWDWSDPGPDPSFFPSPAVLTGEYYLDGTERYGYAGAPQRVSVSIMAHCTGVRPQVPGQPAVLGDYCGVDVVLLFHPAECRFETYYTGHSAE